MQDENPKDVEENAKDVEVAQEAISLGIVYKRQLLMVI